MRCQCLGCKYHEGRCLNMDGQLSLFDDSVIIVAHNGEEARCTYCAPRPFAKPRGDLFYNRREDERLKKQETLFIFL